MAALDFGMAKARGLIAPSTQYETDVIAKAGGRNVFKSEDWWNKQLDIGVKEGRFKESVTERVAPGTFAGRGSFQNLVRQKGYESATPVYEERYIRRSRGAGPQYLPISTPNVDPRRYMKQSYLIGYDAVKRTTASQSDLDAITAASQASTRRAQAEVEKVKASRKRLSRGTGGLIAKAITPGTKADTGLPQLGETGLGIGTAMLGEMVKL